MSTIIGYCANTMGPRKLVIRLLKIGAACFVPHSIVMVRDDLRIGRWRRQRKALDLEQRRRLDQAVGQRENERPQFNYQRALEYLEGRGCDPTQVREGSMPEVALRFCYDKLSERVRSRPVLGLQIGNFVGVSLAFFAWAVKQMDERSLIVSIDPNIPHRGVVNPLQYVIGLLNLFGVQRNVVALTGYSLEKSISNDGSSFACYDPVLEFVNEMSCEQQLAALALLMPARFDFCVIDGNHDPEYLQREIQLVDSTLAPGGLLILDDVWWGFPGVEAIYQNGIHGYITIGTDGRVGVLGKAIKT